MPSPEVECVEHLWIPLADGIRLAGRLWRPADALLHPVPAILEYIPYRKRDGTRARDEPMHGFFAAHGYAAVRVDLRGSGESDGFLDDEYLHQELDDAVEVIRWIAAQSWCSGAVGMMGKSWGGFNALQVAALRPPALKAIITVCSTDDRFADDIHYMGGCLLNDNLWWGSIMLAYQARPPDPALIGATWRERWHERLERMPFWPALWLAHQRRDAYWRHGSVCEDWTTIACPVLAVGGWADAYTNAVPRLLAHLTVPRLGIIGPWAHLYPHDGVPGPAIGFLDEALRWWDHWLKGVDTGIMREPMLRAFIEDYAPPATTRDTAPGRFVGEAAWPSPAIVAETLHLTHSGLAQPAPERERLSVRSPLFVGSACGEWMGTGVAGEMPGDQRADDGLSLVFDTAPLAESVEILGFPRIELELAADRPAAQLAARLCDVAPDGASLRVSYGVLNLAHRAGSAEPRPIVPGVDATATLDLNMCGHRFPAGHRIRLAVSTAYWPLVWPAREAATLTILTGSSRLILPIRRAPLGEAVVSFAPPQRGPRTPVTVLRPGRMQRLSMLDHMSGTLTYLTEGEGGLFGEGVLRLDDIGTALAHDLTRRLSIGADDPLSATASIAQSYRIERGDWSIRIETAARLTGDDQAFTLTGMIEAFDSGVSVFRRDWTEHVLRDHL